MPPGCFPHGKTTSAQCADNAASNIVRLNFAVSCRNMAYWQHRNPNSANTILLKNLPRWRADDIRPYMACAAELLRQKFRGVRNWVRVRTRQKKQRTPPKGWRSAFFGAPRQSKSEPVLFFTASFTSSRVMVLVPSL